MTATTGRRLRRGTLTPEMIVSESLRLLDEEGPEGFSMPKLGRALGADPTAVYRHFASKDALILAIADRLIGQATAGVDPAARACWQESIERGIRSLRATYLAHPAAAALAFCRTTQLPNEIQAVDNILAAVLQAGFEGAEAALMYRAIADFGLSMGGWEASFLSLDPDLQQTDRSAWTRAYRAVDRAEHPHVWQVRDELADIQDEDVFEAILSFVLDGFARRAPRPCSCPRHASAAQLPAAGS
jgi:AcrR family transcriptional regulator